MFRYISRGLGYTREQYTCVLFFNVLFFFSFWNFVEVLQFNIYRYINNLLMAESSAILMQDHGWVVLSKMSLSPMEITNKTANI